MYSFDQANSRLHTDSTKWDRYESRYQLEDVIPLWVADMDFNCYPKITEAMISRCKNGIFGYTDPGEEVYQAIIDWEERKHGITVDKDEIGFATGVVYSFYTLIDLLLKPTDKVIVQTPVYPPFFNTPKSLQREVVYNPLVKEVGQWQMNLLELDRLLTQDPSIRMLIFCNPHNPIGRSWQLAELNALMEICQRHDIIVLSDEIHADIVMPGHIHCSMLRVAEKYHQNIILLGSPTKAFNLAGLKISYLITKNKKWREEFVVTAKANGLSSINIFGFEALKVAYADGDEWLAECNDYIYQNHIFVRDYLQKHLPQVGYEIPEATYLGWLDFSKMAIPNDFNQRLKFEGHVELENGPGFGPGLEQFQRINVACPRSTLTEGLKRIGQWFARE